MKKQWLKCRLRKWFDFIVFAFYILIFIIGVIVIMISNKNKGFLND